MEKKITVMSYNIEHMRRLVSGGCIKDQERAEAVARVIRKVNPHLLGIVEAAPDLNDHHSFLKQKGVNKFGFQVAKGDLNRGKQDLVFYYRAPLELVELDTCPEFYDPWAEDIDEDGIKELCEFERKPLEGLFKWKGVEFMVILVMTKSKGVFSVNDFMTHQYLALANRKRQLAQAKKIRRRVDGLMETHPDLPVIVMGDFNDDPGMDSLERIIGSSTIETMMGSVYHPERILHNALWHLKESGRNVWTAEYPDLIVQNSKDHRGWLDHIFLSPNLIDTCHPLQYIKNSGMVLEKSAVTTKASDHLPIFCQLNMPAGLN